MTRSQVALIGALIALAGCRSAERPLEARTRASDAVKDARLPALRRLDDRHAAEFRRAFEQARERPRYVVALSPT